MSGEVPKNPVISKKTGHLYEKSTLLAYIKVKNACPITGDEMSELDIIEVQSNKVVKPRLVSSTSIPSLLQTFQVSISNFSTQFKIFMDACRMNGMNLCWKHLP